MWSKTITLVSKNLLVINYDVFIETINELLQFLDSEQGDLENAYGYNDLL